MHYGKALNSSLQSRVRIPMNECLGITQDKDVYFRPTQVSRKVLKDFVEGRQLEESELPRAKPMRLDYEGGKNALWNIAVWEAFVPVLLEAEENVAATMGRHYQKFPSERFARDIFMNRVVRLRGYIRELKPRKLADGGKETAAQIKQRISRTAESKRDEARDNTRRNEVIRPP